MSLAKHPSSTVQILGAEKARRALLVMGGLFGSSFRHGFELRFVTGFSCIVERGTPII